MLPSAKGPLFLIVLFLVQLVSSAQETSPYSRFGLGEPLSPSFAPAKAMGGHAAAYRSPFHINFLNPASYSSLRMTTFETGMNFVTKRITDGLSDKTYKAGDGFIDYLALAFPTNNHKAGFSLGLIPYSKMSYEFHEQHVLDSIGEIEKTYAGNGRLYQLYFGGSYNFFKADSFSIKNQLSIGLNAAFVFGNLDQKELLQIPVSGVYNTRISSLLRVNNLALNFGLQYVRQMKKDFIGIAGIYAYSPIASFSESDLRWERFVVLSSGVFTVDTLVDQTAEKNIKVPVQAGAGFTLAKKNWLFSVEGNYEWWDQNDYVYSDGEPSNNFTFRAGGEYVPQLADKNLFKRMSYRIGGYYTDGKLTYKGTRINEYGTTFGFGIPILVFPNDEEIRLDVAFEAGGRGTTNNGLIHENYFKAFIGFSFSNRWFRKFKYD